MKKLLITPLLAAGLLLSGCAGTKEPENTPPPQVEQTQAPDQGGIFQASPLEVLNKSLSLATEGDLKGACEHVVIEEWELSDPENTPDQECIQGISIALALVGSDELLVDTESGNQVDPSPYGESILINEIQDAQGDYWGCAVFTEVGNAWKWHIMETLNSGCSNPPMD